MHQQIAVFVDAGYLCMAAGSAASGQTLGRRSIRLDVERTVKTIIEDAKDLADGRPLLRVYWYDGCPGGTRKTAEHESIASQRDVKLRLGTINREGRQKGVDTMLVLDLMELAQNRAITDAVLLGGDEDLRGGVLRAQALGVRVHLIGIDGANANQSQDLIADADRVLNWSTEKAAELVKILTDEQDTRSDIDPATPTDPMILRAAEEAAQRANLHDVALYWKTHDRGLPADIDGRLLASARGLISRDLTTEEKRALRAHHLQGIKKRMETEALEPHEDAS